MKIFSKDGKINFVDDNSVFVGFDYEASCCEHFGYFFSSLIPTTIDKNSNDPDTTGYGFDTEFIENSPIKDYLYSGDSVAFKLKKERCPDIYLTLYNSHNGYYNHGFSFVDKNKAIKSGHL